MKFPIYLLIFLLFLNFLNCKKTSTPDMSPELSLTLEYVSITEVELGLHLNSPVSPHDFQLLRDNETIMVGPLRMSDTTLYDTLLLPASNYTYQAVVQQTNGVTVQSPELSLTTMDTTSHNYSWEIFTIGNSPIENELYDVSIIDPDDIWVVGFINVRSFSNPSEDKFYNAVHWNGSEWEYHQIYLKDFMGNNYLAFLQSVFALNSDDVWVFGYIGAYGHWDGSHWEGEYVWEMSGDVERIWGNHSQNLYFAGDRGNITRFDGQQWINMSSKTSIRLRDISGYSDPQNSNEIVYSCGFSDDFLDGIILVKPEKEWMILDDGNQGPVSKLDNKNFASLWVTGRNVFYVTAFNKAYKVKTLAGNPHRVKNILSADRGIYRIRGDAENNMFVVGERVKLRHYNGYSWKHYTELDNLVVVMEGLDVKGDLVVAAGGDKIIMGKRRN